MYRHMYVRNECIETMHAEIRLFPIVCLYEDNEAVTVMNVTGRCLASFNSQGKRYSVYYYYNSIVHTGTLL